MHWYLYHYTHSTRKAANMWSPFSAAVEKYTQGWANFLVRIRFLNVTLSQALSFNNDASLHSWMDECKTISSVSLFNSWQI